MSNDVVVVEILNELRDHSSMILLVFAIIESDENVDISTIRLSPSIASHAFDLQSRMNSSGCKASQFVLRCKKCEMLTGSLNVGKELRNCESCQ